MPRLPPSLLQRARNISPHLATLLPVCRDLRSAQNELRWLREHVSASRSKPTLARLCAQRARGAPLQYILGSQPFGDLDIRCRRGVLIPRPETEAWVLHLAPTLASTNVGGGREKALRVVDFCTGSGCIALLLFEQLRRRFPGLWVRGFDVAEQAVRLAKENVRGNAGRLGLGGVGTGEVERGVRVCNGSVGFERADIFAADWISNLLREAGGAVDVLVSNPPYISSHGFDRDTERSVRNYEPRLALVPAQEIQARFADCRPEDVFYARLLEIAGVLRPRVVVFEVGDLAQAVRVVEMAGSKGEGHWDGVEIWRDWPDMIPHEDEEDTVQVGRRSVPIRGSGNGRAVFLRRAV
ncbi:S-adenosyl-L-methionine-dependent methyltransferase [Whalleya microplaca]|nr:S-adenosyl-L-methionine-dependent methyltransferase [Whalleya microplaca]